MATINDTYGTHKEDIQSVVDWVEREYSDKFQDHFRPVMSLYQRMKSATTPVTDVELESVLTDVPLEMFAASGALSQYKLARSVLHINIKKKMQNVARESTEKSATARQAEGAAAVLDDQILEEAMTGLIGRVERELDFARELIMGAKKVWDGRRGSESLGVVKGPTDNLPDYTPNTGTSPAPYGYTTSQAYIK